MRIVENRGWLLLIYLLALGVSVSAYGGYACSYPVLAGQADPADDDGRVKVTMTRTDYPEFLSGFNYYVDGVYAGSVGYHQMQPPRTAVPFWLDTSCMVSPAQLRVVPLQCYNDEYQPGAWSTTISPPATAPTITFTVDKAVDPSNGQLRRRGLVTWNLGKGTNGWVLSVDALPWTAANGVQHSGYKMWPPSGFTVTRTGTAEVFFDPPSGGQQFRIKATAQSCVGAATADYSTDCAVCNGTARGDPVYFNDGNVRVADGDPLPPIAERAMSRTYNSDEQVIGLFGRGWTTFLDRRLIADTDGAESVISITTETNEVVTFRGTAGNYRQTWPQAQATRSSLVYNAAAATYTYRGGGTTQLAVFRASDGKLAELRASPSGRAALISYNASGLPQAVTDSWSGAAWQLTFDLTRRVVTSISATSDQPTLVWNYAYDGAGNLQSVAAPGLLTWRTYEYSNNRLTASRDAVGNLIESHTYDANGFGTSSTGPTDEIQNIEYNLATSDPIQRTTRVTYRTGATSEYVLAASAGAYRTIQASGNCASCGSPRDATYARDARGRPVRLQTADGYITVTTYDGDRVASE